MEPERKIEKLLRAYAKKRKADAGDAFTLHPATRRRLQAEVDRQFAEPPEEESVSLWKLFRQQWAVLAVFALVIFFGASLFLPALSKAKVKSQSASAMSNLRQIGVAAQMAAVDNNGKLPATLDELTNGLLPQNILNDPASGKRFVFAASGEKLDSLSSNAVLAYSPEDKKGRAVLLANGSVQMMSRKQFDDLTQRELKAPAAPVEVADTRREPTEESQLDGKLAFDQPAVTTAPVVASGTMALNGINTFSGGGGGKDFGLENKDRLVATAAPAAALAKQLFKDAERSKSETLGVIGNSQKFRNAVANTAPVLVSFELQQNGSNIAVVDADGSIYQGSLQTNSAIAQNQVPVAAPPGAAQSQISNVANNQVVAGNNFYFRVAGQNRTSKQNVVFTGNLLPLAGGTVNSQAGGTVNNSAGGGEMSQAQNTAIFSNSRIAGTATVDTTNQIEINALPTTP